MINKVFFNFKHLHQREKFLPIEKETEEKHCYLFTLVTFKLQKFNKAKFHIKF